MFKDTMDRTILAGAVVGGGGFKLAEYHAIAGFALTVIMIGYVSYKFYALWDKRRKAARLKK